MNFFMLRGNHESASVTRGRQESPNAKRFADSGPQCMAFMMNAKGGQTSKSGRRLWMFSTVYPSRRQ